MPSQSPDGNEPANATPQTSSNNTCQTHDYQPYTLTRSASGNNVRVDFTSGPREGESITINEQEAQERSERLRGQERGQTVSQERYEYREEDLPPVSYHAADGRLVTKEEYEVIAAREMEEEERQNAGVEAEEDES